MPAAGAHLKPHPHQQHRETVWLLVGGTALAVAGALLAVRHGLLPQTGGGVLLLAGAGGAGWGAGRLVGEQPPPQPSGPAGLAPPGHPGAHLVRPARRDRLGPRLGRAGRRGRGAERLWWPGRWDHGLTSRAAAAAAGWRRWWRRRRLPLLVAQRCPARHARTHGRAGSQ